MIQVFVPIFFSSAKIPKMRVLLFFTLSEQSSVSNFKILHAVYKTAKNITANLQNGNYYKMAKTKRRILQNGEYTKRRILQKGDYYKTATITKRQSYKMTTDTKWRLIQNSNLLKKKNGGSYKIEKKANFISSIQKISYKTAKNTMANITKQRILQKRAKIILSI